MRLAIFTRKHLFDVSRIAVNPKRCTVVENKAQIVDKNDPSIILQDGEVCVYQEGFEQSENAAVYGTFEEAVDEVNKALSDTIPPLKVAVPPALDSDELRLPHTRECAGEGCSKQLGPLWLGSLCNVCMAAQFAARHSKNSKSEKCPDCGSNQVGKIIDGTHCNDCGAEW